MPKGLRLSIGGIAIAGCGLLFLMMLSGFLLGGGFVFRMLHLEGDSYSQTLWVMNVDGTDRRKICTYNHRYLDHPTFAPDGKQILFHQVQDRGVGDIMLIGRNGSSPTRIASTK